MKIEKETEIKFRVNEHIMEKIRGIELESYEETDEYFSTKEMLETSTFLRIRRKKGKTILMLKDITGEAKGIYEADELHMELTEEQYDKLKVMFGSTFPIKFEVRKVRGKGLFNGCEICLDKVDGLGDFLEIEGPRERIVEVCEWFGLDSENSDKERGYAHMISKKLLDYEIRV